MTTNSHLWIRESGEIRLQIEQDSIASSLQSSTSHKKDEQNQVGKQRSEVHNLYQEQRG